MNVLVAGGAGMVGSHLVDSLVARGDQIIVLDNYMTGSPRNLVHLAGRPGFRLVNANITEQLTDIAADWGSIDQIFHLASPASPVAYAREPIATLMVNALGTKHLLDLAVAQGARFVLASTSEVYGDPLVSPQPETYWGNVNSVGPRACYDEGKRFAESLLVSYQRVYGLDMRIARIFNTYGPRSAVDDGRVIPNFCVQALRGEPLTIYGDGNQTRSFCFVSDLVRGMILLSEIEGITGEVINLGNPHEQTVAEIAAEIIRLAGSASTIDFHDLPVDDPIHRRPDITKAGELLGWSPQIDFPTGLARTLDYFRGVI